MQILLQIFATEQNIAVSTFMILTSDSHFFTRRFFSASCNAVFLRVSYRGVVLHVLNSDSILTTEILL